TAATAARFYTALYVDGVLNNSWYTDPPLNANYYTTVTGYSVGSLSAGTHTLEIITDSTGAISESNESDNTYTKTITVVPGTPTLVAANCYVSPATITAGGQLTVYFQIYNPNSSSISIGLGCSIRQNGTSTWLSDPANDVYKTVPSGYSTQTRYYNVPSGSLGSYDVAWGLWQTIGSGSPWDSLTQLNQFTALKTPTWVVMYYMCNGSGGGADLDQYIPAKFSTVAANLNDNIQAFMLVDRSGAGLDRVFRIRQDGNMDDYTDGVDRWTPAQIGLSGSEFDTGSINTINTFTDFVISRSGISGDHYALVIFDHGGGISPTVVGETNLPPVPTGICWDDTGDYLSVADLGNAAAHVKTLLGRNLEVLHLDACLMQMIEVNYELRNSVDYLVASENEGWAIDPSWETYVASITPATTSQALAQAIANTYFTAISGGRTIAVTRPGQAATISSAVDTLASALIQNTAVYRANIATAQNHAQKFAFCHDESWTMDPGNMFLDVRDLCQELVAVVPVTGVQTAANSVIAAIGNAGGPFLVSEQHANDSGATQNNGFWFDKGTYGLSIFFPRSPQDANCFNTYNTYNNYINQSATPANLAFTAATHWDEFLQAFFSPGNLQFASSTYSVNENGGSIRIHVSRTGGSYGAAGVSYATADGSAGAGSDYTAVSGTLSWADGDATDKYADVPIIDEGSYSGNEYFTLNLSGASGASLGSPITTTVTIIDNDTPPSRGNLQFASSAYSVNENGGSIRIYVNRTGGSYGAAGVNYATADGSAGAGSDYTAVSGTLSWVDGDAADKYVDVLIIDKGSYSGNEYFTVSLSGASGAALGSPTTTTVTITDNDTPPTACFRAPQHLANGAVQLVLDCVQGSTYWVQCSTNLASWRAIFSITPSSNVITLTDTKAIGLPLCYYRALGFSATNATPHPADLNADYTISTSEYLAYSNAYVTTGPWPIPPCPVPAAYYTNANLIWQTNGYHINPALPPPDCWVPGR
ncbi:MAG: Calx-beta domain-containing protein, partial [Verrucomicrobiota bacterium]